MLCAFLFAPRDTVLCFLLPMGNKGHTAVLCHHSLFLFISLFLFMFGTGHVFVTDDRLSSTGVYCLSCRIHKLAGYGGGVD